MFLNDPELDMKIDLRFPVNFLIHGWLGGLSGGTSYLPDDFKPKGKFVTPKKRNESEFRLVQGGCNRRQFDGPKFQIQMCALLTGVD